MAISTKVDPIDRDIELILKDTLSPQARSAMLADFAKTSIKEAEEIDRQVLGRVPRKTVWVDGQKGAALEQVKPDGVIVAEFELVTDVLQWIGEQLELHSPVGGKGDKHPGLYKQSHVLFADDAEVAIGGDIPPAETYVFANAVPYARKIELGSSSQAPDGVYQAVATLAQRRFGNVARISFSYRAVVSGGLLGGHAGNKSDLRQPAIIVKLGGR